MCWGRSLIVCGPVLLLLGLSGSIVTDALLLIVLGMGWECICVAAQSSLQLEIPTAMRGPMLTLFYTGIMVATVLGSVAVGWAMDQIGSRDSLAIFGIVVCVFGVISLVRFTHAAATGELTR